MQTSPEIVFEGLPVTPQIKDAIDAHLAELEQRWGRISCMPCRCEGTRSTAPHRWSIRCPYTSRPPRRSRSQRHKDTAGGRATPTLTLAVHDAFKHARRQLQDQVRRIQGHIKDHQDSADSDCCADRPFRGVWIS